MENADWVRKIKVIINSTQISLDSGFPGCQCRIQDAFLSSFLLETLTAFSEDFRIKKFEIFFFLDRITIIFCKSENNSSI